MIASVYDVRTGYLIAGIVFTIMPVITWALLRREQARSVDHWSAGGLVLSLGLYLVGLRGELPDALTFGLANVLVLLGNLLHLHALRLEAGKPNRLGWLAFLALLLPGIKELLRFTWPDPNLHPAFAFAYLAVVTACITHIAWDLARQESADSPRWIALVHATAFAIFAARLLLAALGWTNIGGTDQGAGGLATTVVVIFVAIISNVAMVGLYMERFQRRAIQARALEERGRALSEMADQIAYLDRQRSMSEMAGAIAHELGQPVTGILMDCRSLSKGLNEPQQRPETLRSIASSLEEQAERMRLILSGIRNFIKPSRPQLEPSELGELAHAVAGILGPSLGSQPVDLRIVVESPSPLVMGDKTQLSQVILNLLRNAAEARVADRRLQIRLEITSSKTHALVRIEDNGCGLSETQLASFATPFVTSKTDGMGIGLAISRQIITAHGGAMQAHRPASGQGLLVTLELPLAEASNRSGWQGAKGIQMREGW